jgi:nickel/cobalt exporter
VAIVAIAAGVLNVTAGTMRRTTDIIEIASYSFIMAIGTRLFCVKGVALIGAMLGRVPTAMEKAVATLVEALLYIAVIEFAVASIVTLLQPSLLVVAIAHQVVGAAALWLLWTAGSPVVALWKASKTNVGTPSPAGIHHAHAHAHHGHAHERHVHHDPAHHTHTHESQTHDARAHVHGHGHADHHHGHGHHHGHHHEHDHASAWGHAHAPEPQELAGPGGWKRGLSATIAVGLRPCSGAILVLVFTLSQGLFWAGVVATFIMGLGTAITVAGIAVLSVLATGWAERFASSRGGLGTILMRGIEVGAALLITCFGGLLLLGYMASERLPV